MNNQKKAGLVLMICAVVFFIIGYSYVRSAEKALFVGHEVGPKGECLHPAGAVCPYAQLDKLQRPKYAALFFDLLIFLGGAMLFFQKSPDESVRLKSVLAAKKLKGDERRVFDIILSEPGIYQSDIVERTKLSKVSVTRILDRLESKELIERKRRGMTNIITLRR